MQLITRLMSLIWSHDISQAGLHIHNCIRRAWKYLYAHLNLIMMIFCTSCCYSTHWWSVLFSNRKTAKTVCGSQISLMFEGPYATYLYTARCMQWGSCNSNVICIDNQWYQNILTDCHCSDNFPYEALCYLPRHLA